MKKPGQCVLRLASNFCLLIFVRVRVRIRLPYFSYP